MKRFFELSILAVAIMACSKQEVVEPELTQEGKQVITATAVMPLTKLSYTENTPGGGSGLSSKWEVGDSFKAIQKTGGEVSVVEFTLVSGENSTSATFKTETEGVTAETEWIAILGNHSTVEAEGTEIHCSYKGQTGTLSGVDDYNYVKATATGVNPSFTFSTSYSYIMRIILPAGIKCIEYTPSAYWKVSSDGPERKWYNTDKYADNDNGAYAAFESGNTSIITLETASASGDVVYIAVPSISFSLFEDFGDQKGNTHSGVIITIMNDISANATESNGWVLGDDISGKGGNIRTFDLSSSELIKRPRVSDAIRITSSSVSGSWRSGALQQSATTVDTYWAPFNMEANNDYETGKFYGFGEINEKTNYTQENYAYYGGGNDDVISVKSKIASSTGYCTIAGSRYDVARVKWGVAWRMPHLLEFLALGKHSPSNRVTKSGHSGVQVGELFLPITGRKEGTGTTDYGGNYQHAVWTADKVNRSKPNVCWDQSYFFVPSTSNGISAGDDFDNLVHYKGLPVRAVLASSVME